MRTGARIVWVTGELIVALAVAAGVAWAKDYQVASLLAAGLTLASVAVNWALLRGLEASMEHRLMVRSSRKMSIAPNAAALLGFLVPVGDMFSEDLGWLLMFLLLFAAMVVRQLVKATPPGLFLLACGYRPQQVTVDAGTVEVWARGKTQLSPNDVVKAVEAEQALWLGVVSDV